MTELTRRSNSLVQVQSVRLQGCILLLWDPEKTRRFHPTTIVTSVTWSPLLTFVIGFNNGLPYYVKNTGRGTQVDNGLGFCHD